MANTTQRSGFEQQLCRQLLSFSELTEALAERVLLLEQRLAGLEQHLTSSEQTSEIEAGIEDLLTQSEDRVRKVKDVLRAGDVVALETARQWTQTDSADGNPVHSSAETEDEQDVVTADDDAETEYVDDPQIDLLSA